METLFLGFGLGVLAVAGLAMFGFVFLKAFQQRNVAFDAPVWVVLLLSYGMSYSEVYVISVIATLGFSPELGFAIGTGSGWGAVTAMALHRKIFGKQGSKNDDD